MSELSGIRFGGVIASAAKAHGLDPKLLAAVAAQESGGPGVNSGRNVVGDEGHGHGLFQLDDRWQAFAKTPAVMDVAKNADYAAAMIQKNLKVTGGDLRAALSMYNAGSPHAVGTKTTWGDGTTLGYADSVLRHAREIGASLTSELLAGRHDDAAAIGGLALAAARRHGAADATAAASPSIATNSAAENTSNAWTLVRTLLQSAGGTPLPIGPTASVSAAPTTAGTSPLAPPGALQMSSPVTQNGATFRSYQNEMSAASNASNDADGKIATFVDSASDVFGAERGAEA